MKNSADLGECYPPRPSASVDNTLLDLQNSSYPTQPHSIIANYKFRPWIISSWRLSQPKQRYRAACPIAEHFSCRALSHYLSRTYLQKGQHVGGPQVYQPWLLRVHPREIKLVVVVVVVGAKPPPKCFTISWKFRVISYYFDSIDSFFTKLGE